MTSHSKEMNNTSFYGDDDGEWIEWKTLHKPEQRRTTKPKPKPEVKEHTEYRGAQA